MTNLDKVSLLFPEGWILGIAVLVEKCKAPRGLFQTSFRTDDEITYYGQYRGSCVPSTTNLDIAKLWALSEGVVDLGSVLW